MQATEKYGITLFIDFKVAVESIDTFIQLLADVIQKASQEPEFLSSDVLSDPQQPGRIILVENWAESEVWMNENFFTKQYMKDYHSATQPLLLPGTSKTILKRVGRDVAKAKKGSFQLV